MLPIRFSSGMFCADHGGALRIATPAVSYAGDAIAAPSASVK
jgi:hypothetical protein